MPADLMQKIDRVLDWNQRHVEPKAGDFGTCRMQRKSIDEDKRQIHFLCSSGSVDRYGEIVEPSAYAGSIESFMLNPVFAAGHVYIGNNGEPTIIGEWVKLWISKDGLEGIAEFDDEDPLAQRYWNLYRKGRMRSVSVGFIANAWKMRDVETGQDKRRVRVFTDVDLLEVSAVAIPANPDARVRSRGAGGSHEDDLDARMEAAAERAIEKRFSTDPGGLMTTLAQDVAELVVAHVGPGADPYGDIPDPGDVPAPGTEDQGESQHNLNAALRDVLGK
ncbi:MAG: HK97 family phage prohead protease [Planctomycetota bacterium]